MNIDGLKIDLGTLGGPNSWINDRGEAVGLAETSVPDPDGEDFCAFGTGLMCRPFLWQNGLLGKSPAQTAQPSMPLFGRTAQSQTSALCRGDFAAFASGINNQGQVVGSTTDSNFNWSHGFIWQNGVMADLNTLFPASSNLYATMANKINERGQISGMATVLSGPHAGEIHAFLVTPVNESIGNATARTLRNTNP